MSSSVQPVGSARGPGDDPGSVDPAAKPVRRSFTAEYRARVVAEYAAAPHGEKSAVLRREGLYQSQIREWTDARDAIAQGLPPRPNSHHRSGRKSAGSWQETDRLRAENARLTRELAKSQAVVEIMGKLQGLLEAISESTDTSAPPTKR
jgi:transposase